MFANERQQLILDELSQRHSITVSELVERFHVSTETIRRDLETMEKQTLLKRVHGGAISILKTNRFEDVNKRTTSNVELKTELCKTALSFIEDGDVIAIDSGTTAATLALAIKKRSFHSLTVITYSSEVFTILSDCPNCEIIITGGSYLPKERIFCGFLSHEALKHYHFTKSFVIPSALSLAYGAQDFIPEVYENQLSLIRNTEQLFLLADHTKFETSGNLKLCELLPEYIVITDSGLPDSIYEQYRRQQINLIR